MLAVLRLSSNKRVSIYHTRMVSYGRKGKEDKREETEENNRLWKNDANVARIEKTTTSVLYKQNPKEKPFGRKSLTQGNSQS